MNADFISQLNGFYLRILYIICNWVSPRSIQTKM